MITRQQAEEAADFMSIALDDLNYTLLTARYRELVKKHHPDTGADLEDWRTLKRAHDTLGAWLRQIRHVEGECPECGGSGRTRTRPVRWCRACQGRGRRVG